jgi:hypothetical protein
MQTPLTHSHTHADSPKLTPLHADSRMPHTIHTSHGMLCDLQDAMRAAQEEAAAALCHA